MKRQYILRLSELHAIFAHIHTIGNIISGSRLQETWIEAELFDSKSIVGKVLGCKNMVRAIEAHEATMTASEIHKITEIMLHNPHHSVGVTENIPQNVNKAIISMEISKANKLSDAFFTLNSLLATLNGEQSFSKAENFQLELITLFPKMVEGLFSFSEESRTRNQQ